MIKTKDQTVYLFRHKGTDFVKIGMSTKNDCQDRFNAFCTYAPNGGEIVGIIKTNDSKKLEKKLHNDYASKRINGEFFILTQDECDAILDRNKVKYHEDVINLIKLIETDLGIESMYKVKMFCKHLLSLNISKDEVDCGIREFFKETNEYKYTATELRDLLFSEHNIEYNLNNLGIKLSKYFEKKKVKVNGKVVSLYKCELAPVAT